MKKPQINSFKVILSYMGTNYCGWQKQLQGEKTIQGELEFALSKLAKDIEISTMGSGRTDAGVHAIGQVVKIDVSINIDANGLLRALNSHLPKDIRVVAAETCNVDFMPTVHAKSKEYRYYFSNQKVVPAPMNLQLAHIYFDLDIDLMKEGAKLFIGEHDFQNYFCVGTPVKSTVREIYECEIIAVDNFLHAAQNSTCFCFRVNGSGFLKQMVRLMMGVLFELGRGKITLQDIENSLKNPLNEKLGPVAPPEGLYLYSVQY